jgi:hypothetical protein
MDNAKHLIRFNEELWHVSPEQFKKLMTDIATALEPYRSKDPSGVFQTPAEPHPWWTETINMEDYATRADDTLRFDFDEDFSPWEELERIDEWTENDERHIKDREK